MPAPVFLPLTEPRTAPGAPEGPGGELPHPERPGTLGEAHRGPSEPFSPRGEAASSPQASGLSATEAEKGPRRARVDEGPAGTERPGTGAAAASQGGHTDLQRATIRARRGAKRPEGRSPDRGGAREAGDARSAGGGSPQKARRSQSGRARRRTQDRARATRERSDGRRGAPAAPTSLAEGRGRSHADGREAAEAMRKRPGPITAEPSRAGFPRAAIHSGYEGGAGKAGGPEARGRAGAEADARAKRRAGGTAPEGHARESTPRGRDERHHGRRAARRWLRRPEAAGRRGPDKAPSPPL